MESKDGNPKQVHGVKKIQFHVLPAPVLGELSVGMLEGALKYGAHNWRPAGVCASTYYDACLRHLMAWWEGEEIDPVSEISHITKAMACLMVLRDSQMQGNSIDDRPPKSDKHWQEWFNAKTEVLLSKFPEPKEPFLERSI